MYALRRVTIILLHNNNGGSMINVCEVCKIEFESLKPAKTCSPKCRVTLSRSGVTRDENVTLADPNVTRDVTFEFYTISKANGTGRKSDEKSETRKATYWYDVPIAAIPIIKKDWPKMPDYMNGRQYFLWWKNEFKTNTHTDTETGEVTDMPEILNPLPKYDKLEYVKAGEGSRHWGTV